MSKVLAPLLVLQAEGDLALVFLWLGVVFACILLPSSFALSDPPTAVAAVADGQRSDEPDSAAPYLRSSAFIFMWVVFFFNIAAGISVISFQSELMQEVWGFADPSLEPAILVEYGATLIAVSSLCNGVRAAVLGAPLGPHRSRPGLQDSARQSDDRLRYPDD